jgi:hypothetical protein
VLAAGLGAAAVVIAEPLGAGGSVETALLEAGRLAE